MPDKGSGGKPKADTNTVDTRLLELLETVVRNQTVQAVADLHAERAELIEAEMRRREGDRRGYGSLAGGLAYPQLQLGLFFRSVRNGLGNLGRHGERDAALLPAPKLDQHGTLWFVAPLPQKAERLNLVKSDGTVLRYFTDVGGEMPVIENAGEVAWVQVDDKHGNPILLGVPFRVAGGLA